MHTIICTRRLHRPISEIGLWLILNHWNFSVYMSDTGLAKFWLSKMSKKMQRAVRLVVATDINGRSWLESHDGLCGSECACGLTLEVVQSKTGSKRRAAAPGGMSRRHIIANSCCCCCIWRKRLLHLSHWCRANSTTVPLRHKHRHNPRSKFNARNTISLC